MVFNDNYDKILWLILKYDNSNRERILEFIENIPCEFLIKIQNVIKEYVEYKLDNSVDKEKKNFYGEYCDGCNKIYHFCIDNDCDTLFVGKYMIKYGKMFSDFGLLLTNGIDIKNINEICEYMIGKLTFDYDVINDGMKTVRGKYTSIDYKLLDFLLGYVMIISNQDRVMFKDMKKIVSIDNIPKDYDINDVKKLIRKRETKK